MQTYKFDIDSGDFSYREFHIKKRNGKTRRICAPSPDLLRAQRAALPVLENRFLTRELDEFGTANIFHGFVKNRNIVTCALNHVNKAHTITLDISNCFDSITKEMLEQEGLTVSPLYFHENGSLAQGFATSPILANYYLISPIRDVINTIRAYDDTAVITVYADDIQISISETNYEFQNLYKAIVTKIFKKYGLTINPSKTRTHHAKYGNRRILGIMVGSTISPSRKLKGKIRAARHQKNGPSLGGLVTASRMYLPKALRPLTPNVR